MELPKGPSHHCCNSRSSPTYRLHSRGSMRVPPYTEEPRFHLMAREEGSFHCAVGKEFPAFSSHLKRRRSPQERREELQGRANIPRVPQMSQSILGKPFSLHCLDCQAEDRLTARWHVGQPCGKASWESHRSLDPREEKRDTAATAREEIARACPHSRRGLTPLGRLRKYPNIHVSTGEESSGSGTASNKVLCRGPAPVDPGNSKGGRRWRGKTCLFINVRLD